MGNSAFAQSEYSAALETLGSVRVLDSGERRFPVSQYVRFDDSIPKGSTHLHLDLRYSNDILKESGRIDLYGASVRFAPWKEKAIIELGRGVLAESETFYLLDGAKLEGRFKQDWTWKAFGGWSHTSNLTTGIERQTLFGGRLGLPPAKDISTEVVYVRTSRSGVDDNEIGLALRRPLLTPVPSSLRGELKYSLHTDQVSKAYAMYDASFTPTVSASLLYRYTDVDEPIYILFARGRSHFAEPGVTWALLPSFSIETAYTLNRYAPPNQSTQNAQGGRIGATILSDVHHFRSHVEYSYLTVSRGFLHRALVETRWFLTSEVQCFGLAETARYQKDGQGRAWASRLSAGLDFPVYQNIRFAASGELNNNEAQKRGYLFWFGLFAPLGGVI